MDEMENQELLEKIKKVKILVMDVDGTLTDSAMYYSANGEELKRFSTRDGMGITLLHKAGIKTAILTSEDSAVAMQRAKKLKIDEVVLGSRDKETALKEIANKYSLKLEEIGYVGDDVNDLPAMEIAGFVACPADSTEFILEISHFISNFNGGNGAVREICDLILKIQEKPLTLERNW